MSHKDKDTIFFLDKRPIHKSLSKVREKKKTIFFG